MCTKQQELRVCVAVYCSCLPRVQYIGFLSTETPFHGRDFSFGQPFIIISKQYSPTRALQYSVERGCFRLAALKLCFSTLMLMAAV